MISTWSKFYNSEVFTYFPNLCFIVGDWAGGMIGCLGDEVDGTVEFQDFVSMSWKIDVFVRFWEL